MDGHFVLLARFPGTPPPPKELFSRSCGLELRHICLTEGGGSALYCVSLPTSTSER